MKSFRPRCCPDDYETIRLSPCGSVNKERARTFEGVVVGTIPTVVEVWVKPRSKKGPLVESDPTGRLIVYVREPAVDGKANQATIGLLAKYFEVAPRCIELISGQAARRKRFRIHR